MRIYTHLLLTLCLVLEIEAQNWAPQTSGTTNALASVHFVNADIGWAVGATGTIIKTVNGGANWTLQTSGVSEALYSVHFANRDTGWTVGGYVGEMSRGFILHTVNGGANWAPQLSIGTPLHSVHFAGPSVGYVVGDAGLIFKTADGGSNWTRLTGPLYYWNSARFANADTGWAVGSNGAVAGTVDGGANWTVQTPTAQSLYSVHFPTPFAALRTVYAVGSNGAVLRSSNGGAWIPLTGTTSQYFHSVHFTGADTGYIAGRTLTTPAGGFIRKTTDGGNNWTGDYAGNSALSSVHFPAAAVGYAVGANGTILKYGPALAITAKSAPRADLRLSLNAANGTVKIFIGGRTWTMNGRKLILPPLDAYHGQ